MIMGTGKKLMRLALAGVVLACAATSSLQMAAGAGSGAGSSYDGRETDARRVNQIRQLYFRGPQKPAPPIPDPGLARRRQPSPAILAKQKELEQKHQSGVLKKEKNKERAAKKIQRAFRQYRTKDATVRSAARAKMKDRVHSRKAAKAARKQEGLGMRARRRFYGQQAAEIKKIRESFGIGETNLVQRSKDMTAHKLKQIKEQIASEEFILNLLQESNTNEAEMLVPKQKEKIEKLHQERIDHYLREFKLVEDGHLPNDPLYKKEMGYGFLFSLEAAADAAVLTEAQVLAFAQNPVASNILEENKEHPFAREVIVLLQLATLEEALKAQGANKTSEDYKKAATAYVDFVNKQPGIDIALLPMYPEASAAVAD